MTMIVYKIRTKDGLFSKGGTHISPSKYNFNSKGKIWKRQSDLTSHLNQLSASSIQVYKSLGAEVVEYEVMERETASKTLEQYLVEIKQRKDIKEAERKQRYEEYQRALRKKQFEELKKEFETDK